MKNNPTAILTEYLKENENLLWTGKPKTGILFRPSDIFYIPISLIWCGFVIFWMIGVIQSGAPLFFVLWGIPFVMVGLMFVFGRFIHDIKLRQSASYGLTENRIIIKYGIFSKKIKSIQLKTLSDLELSEKKSGIGTIILGSIHSQNLSESQFDWFRDIPFSSKLEEIKNARFVYDQILDVQNHLLLKK